MGMLFLKSGGAEHHGPFLFSGGRRRTDDSLDGALDEIALLRRAET
jgi:hypothetical protein